jgi:5-methylcytosine-specific restriction endonuclease McrA
LEYRLWREGVFQKDNFTCQKCGVVGVSFQAHHKNISFSDLLKKYKILTLEQAITCKELWDISIGETLCKHCHGLLHPNLHLLS